MHLTLLPLNAHQLVTNSVCLLGNEHVVCSGASEVFSCRQLPAAVTAVNRNSAAAGRRLNNELKLTIKFSKAEESCRVT